MAAGAIVTITVPPLSGGVGTISTPDYSTEILALTAEMKLIATSLEATTAALTAIGLQLLNLETFLLAVQSPTGDFRTLSPEDVVANSIVTTALSKNVPPIVATPGATS